MDVFLSPAEAASAESRQVRPRPATPRELGVARLGIAYAQQRDGSLALIGPTLRDLRQGWDTMGSMGSGKSSLVETMVYEIARLGGGCWVIDAKGDLCDRLLDILPPEAYDRVIMIATTAAWGPCSNPCDRRLIRDKPRDGIAGEIGQIFARIERRSGPARW
ncbi:MAG: type IV secretory system conjugative DNA transfer family protein, partial [Chloroflexus sp.]